jgi:hypothetical protein
MSPYVHLSIDERLQIYQFSQDGLSQVEIARRLGRDKATISRELRRNAVSAGYLPDLAQRQYRARRRHCGRDAPCFASARGPLRRIRRIQCFEVARITSPSGSSRAVWAVQQVGRVVGCCRLCYTART